MKVKNEHCEYNPMLVYFVRIRLISRVLKVYVFKILCFVQLVYAMMITKICFLKRGM